jgi:hypothetical protein
MRCRLASARNAATTRPITCNRAGANRNSAYSRSRAASLSSISNAVPRAEGSRARRKAWRWNTVYIRENQPHIKLS